MHYALERHSLRRLHQDMNVIIHHHIREQLVANAIEMLERAGETIPFDDR